MKKEECGKLLSEFRDLKTKIDTVFKAQDYELGKPIKKLGHLTPEVAEGINRIKEVAKMLIDGECRECLDIDAGEWFEINKENN